MPRAATRAGIRRNASQVYILSDNFNRADGGVGNNWLVPSNDTGGVAAAGSGNLGWRISGNTLGTGSEGFSPFGKIESAYYPLLRDLGSAVQDFSVDILSTNSLGVCWGYVTKDDCWFLRLHSNGTDVYIRNEAGGSRVLDVTKTVSGSHLGRYHIVYGGSTSSTITFPDGSSNTYTSTAHAGIHAGPVMFSGATSAWDNFLVPGVGPSITDNFAGSGNNVGQTTTTGSKLWVNVTGLSGTLQRSGGQLVGTGAGSNARNTVDTGSTVGSVQATLLGTGAQVYSRYGGSSNYFALGAAGTSTWRVVKANGTTNTLYDTGISSTVQATLRIDALAGDVLNFYVNNVLVYTTTDSANSTYTNAAISLLENNTADDFAYWPA